MKRCIQISDELVNETEAMYGKLTNGVIEQWVSDAIKKEIEEYKAKKKAETEDKEVA